MYENKCNKFITYSLYKSFTNIVTLL